MEIIDPSTQERVWKRVMGEPMPIPKDPSLMVTEAEIAAQLRWLMRYYPKKAPLLRQMLAQTREHLACLQGIHLLRQGKRPPHPPGNVRNYDPSALVRKCYVNCLHLASKYEAAAEDQEYGIVYAEMATTKRRHCAQLLTLLGYGSK